jgi:hypothetical protein
VRDETDERQQNQAFAVVAAAIEKVKSDELQRVWRRE